MDRPKEYQSLLPRNEAYPIGSETREIRLASPASRSVQFVMVESGNNPVAAGNETDLLSLIGLICIKTIIIHFIHKQVSQYSLPRMSVVTLKA
jgi:hypothetical protein